MPPPVGRLPLPGAEGLAAGRVEEGRPRVALVLDPREEAGEGLGRDVGGGCELEAEPLGDVRGVHEGLGAGHSGETVAVGEAGGVEAAGVVGHGAEDGGEDVGEGAVDGNELCDGLVGVVGAGSGEPASRLVGGVGGEEDLDGGDVLQRLAAVPVQFAGGDGPVEVGEGGEELVGGFCGGDDVVGAGFVQVIHGAAYPPFQPRIKYGAGPSPTRGGRGVVVVPSPREGIGVVVVPYPSLGGSGVVAVRRMVSRGVGRARATSRGCARCRPTR